MSPFIRLTSLAVLGFSLALTAPARATAAPAAPEQTPLTQSRNTFAVELYNTLSKDKGNIFFSPYSIATALTMVFVGANGETEVELAQTLHLDTLSPLTGFAQKQAILKHLKTQKTPQILKEKGIEIHIANALWGNKKYPLDPTYVDVIQKHFLGTVDTVDFSDEVFTRDKINGWIAHNTAQKIQNLLPPKTLMASTRLVLTNAIYFKAKWHHIFDKNATHRTRFYLAPAKSVPAEMMNQHGNFLLTARDTFKILNVPYQNDDASLIILLPNAIDGLPEIEKALTPQALNRWLAESKKNSVDLSLPKFKASSAFNVEDKLASMGIKTAFSPKTADFTAIAPLASDKLFLEAILHKAFAWIDEEGTEAATATLAIMGDTATAPDQASVPFVANHPFLYLIRANQTGDILFLGRLENPNQEE